MYLQLQSLTDDAPEMHALKLSTQGKFERAMYAYQERDFDKSLQVFRQVLQINPNDTVATLYAERIQAYQAQGLAPDWNGINVLEGK